jgi:nitroimidazol reductase NimA-like FMN-containing flavoprotein (pyridoxamine 5'-phosphate oxidase superfamily)
VTEDLTRKRDRRARDRAALDALLDEQPVGTLSTVTTDGEPWAVPMLFARDGDRVLLHGSTGAGALRRVAAGAPAVFSTVALDALVLATSMLEHSANYRSAVIHGRLETLTGDEAWRALDLISDGLIPGRREEVLPMTRKDVAATIALSLPIAEDNWILKTRTGGTGEDDVAHPDGLWTGVLPVRTSYGTPERSPWLGDDVPLSPAVRGLLDAQPPA